VSGPGEGASAMNGERREWLERLQTAAHRALDDVRDSDDPVLQGLAADLSQFAARLQSELEPFDRGGRGAPGIS
jgi:hypothetical protein